MGENNQLKNEKEAKILIIDDNLANIMLLEKMLKIYGYTNTKTSTDSRQVLKIYTEWNPDLILLDLKMPFLDGFQVLEQLNEIKGEDYLSIIVVTAQNDKKNLLKALDLGAKDFIGKPFDHSEVMMRIRNMLEMRLLHNQVIENNRILEEKVKERTEELQDLQIELIQRLVKAAEFRDNDTGSHINRIGLYTSELAKLVGISKYCCNLLHHASMMHDIGKIGIADEILLKPGKLNAEEWVKMKLHTIKGAQILTGSTFEIIKMGEKIALTHHEKWDGSGYPNGLKGEEIPLVGRITALCDVFDALLSKRPYKEPWPLDKVLAEIKKGSGNHFDPSLVCIFLDSLPIFLDIKEKYQ